MFQMVFVLISTVFVKTIVVHKKFHQWCPKVEGRGLRHFWTLSKRNLLFWGGQGGVSSFTHKVYGKYLQLTSPGSGQTVILTPSITGCPRWYLEQTLDCLALTRRKGKPTLFITITCNVNWKEIRDSLHPGETAFDRPDICARVFKKKSTCCSMKL